MLSKKLGKELSKIKIFLDPGHGGSDSGACAYGLVEKEINLVMALACKEKLESLGFQVKMSRTDNSTSLSLRQRCDMANAWGADYFISVHNNAGGGDGFEAIHSIMMGEGEELAQSIAQKVKSNVGQNVRRTFARENSRGTDYYGVIRMTKMPAIITEGAFLDNAKDNDIIDTKAEQEKFGLAIADGLLDFLEVEVEEKKEVDPNVFYRVCIGSYNEYDNAVDAVAKAKEKGYNAFIAKYNRAD